MAAKRQGPPTKIEYDWQMVSFLQLVDHCQGKERWTISEEAVKNHPSNDAADNLQLSDNTVVAALTEHDAGYSEDTPSGPQQMAYWIGTPKKSNLGD